MALRIGVPVCAVATVLLLLHGAAASRPFAIVSTNIVGTNIGRNLTATAPGCKESCCYNPTWWLDSRTAPSVKCTKGGGTSFDAAVLAKACNDGSFPGERSCSTGGTGSTSCGNRSGAKCEFTEDDGSHVDEGMLPCTTIDYNGKEQEVYSAANLYDGNNEIVWACADAPEGGPAGVSACSQGATESTYRNGASFSKTSGWNIGAQLDIGSESMKKAFETLVGGFKITGGYTQTETKGVDSSVSVTAKPGEHGCITKGTLIHHAVGTMRITGTNINKDDCEEWEVTGWAIDAIINDQKNPLYATAQQWGTEVKPCGYPLLNGAV